MFADIGDRISVGPASGLSLSVSGPLASHAPAGPDNLVLKAAALFREHADYGGGAEIRLEKHLPAGAGLGGGSADAAAVLHALNELWGIGASPDELCALARPLGADVPMCMAGQALRARGTGERIEAVEGWPTLPMVLVWPGRPVSTPEVFRSLERRDNSPLREPPRAGTARELAEWLGTCRNDLEGPAMRLAPEIGEVLETLRATPGCVLARMSGSGSGCFAIYGNREEARRAAATLADGRPDWWIAPTLAH